MDDKEFNDVINEDEIEKLETTKEVQTLKDLSITAIHNIENGLEEEFDDNMKDADLVFQTVVDTKENMKKEEEKKEEDEEKKKKENPFKKLKNKWQTLEKKKKIIIIVVSILILIAIAIGLFFLLKKEPPKQVEEPDVVLEMDNYRYENGKLIFLDGDEELGSYECENKDETLCEVAYLTEEDDFSTTKKVDEEGKPLKIRAKIYQDRFVFVIDRKEENDKRIKVYDMKTNEVIKTVFAVKAYDEYEDYVILKNEESLYGLEHFTKEKMETVIPYSYDELGILPNQEEIKLLAVRKDNNSYLADLQNKILTKAFTTSIVEATDTHLITKDATDKYRIYNYNGTEIDPGQYDYATLLDDLVLTVEDNKLYILDYENHKMKNEGIPLKNNKYNPVETYEDYKLKKTEKSFTANYENNILNINVYEGEDYENFSVNILEGKLSSKLAFMNYFDGSIYFYSDANKETLIGSYPCTNKNAIDENTTTLVTCKLATDSFYHETTGNTKEMDHSAETGAIPLINKQYVFVLDGDTVVLYDLVNKKELAKYTNVDTASYTNVTDLTFVNTNNVYFIAVSKSSGKFGVAKITMDGVSPVLPFEFNSIKKLGDYYVCESDNGYALYNVDGKKLTADKNSPIVDYLEVDDTHKYLKTYKDNMYFVHSYEKEISSSSYNYIELYDEYYAAVLNNKVHVYTYDNEEITISEEGEKGVSLNITNYYGTGTKAFRITFDEKNVYVEVGNSNNTYGSKIGFPKVKESGSNES